MKLSAPIAALAALCLLAGCSGGISKKSQEGKANVLRYPIVVNPSTLDPGIVQDGFTIDMLQQVYEGLVMWSEDNQPVGNLAESWEVTDEGRGFVFTLKKGVKFHSGREVTADDFKWSFERSTNPAFNSSTAKTYLSDIVGVPDKLAGKAKEISGITVLDPYKLKILIDKPRPYFLGKLTYIISAVVDKDVVPADREIRSVEEMGGTGPFRASKYVPEQIIALEANKDYHGGAPQIAGVERPVIKDAATRLNMYKGGELDMVALERQDVGALQADPEFKDHLQFFQRPATWYVGLNQLVYPQFKDRRVRRAFAMAIDRKTIVEDILGGINKEANGIVPPGVWGYREDAKALPYDPDQAKRLLAEAGFPGGKGFPELELTFMEQKPDIRIVAERVATYLKQNLGITAELRTMEWRAYLEKHQQNKMGFFHMRWGADYLDPENFLSVLLASYGPEMHVGYVNPEYDALCRAADVEQDPERRKQLYAQAEELVVNDAPFIPIFFQRDAELINPKVKGLRESLFGHLPHTRVSLNGG
jgi:ABC-type transport system substrate-binding protein